MIEDLTLEIIAFAGAGILAYLSGLTTWVIKNYKSGLQNKKDIQKIMQLLYGYQQKQNEDSEGHIQRTDKQFDELLELAEDNNKKINSLITVLDQENVVEYDEVEKSYEILDDN